MFGHISGRTFMYQIFIARFLLALVVHLSTNNVTKRILSTVSPHRFSGRIPGLRQDVGFTCYTLFCWGSTISSLGVHLPALEDIDATSAPKEPWALRVLGRKGDLIWLDLVFIVFLVLSVPYNAYWLSLYKQPKIARFSACFWDLNQEIQEGELPQLTNWGTAVTMFLIELVFVACFALGMIWLLVSSTSGGFTRCSLSRIGSLQELVTVQNGLWHLYIYIFPHVSDTW